MSAKVFPLVSIMKTITKTVLRPQITAKIEKMPAFPIASTTLEKDTVTMNASSQFKKTALDDATLFNFGGKISPMYNQGIGPARKIVQVEFARKTICEHLKRSKLLTSTETEGDDIGTGRR